MATEADIIIDEPATVDRRADAFQLTQPVSLRVVVREGVVLTGAENYLEIARVLNANPATADYALLVRTLQGFNAANPLFDDPIDRALRDIGKVDIAAFDAALPAGTARIGRIEFNAATVANLTSAQVNAAGAGDNTLVAGIAGQTIRLWKIFLVVNAAVNIQFKSGATTLTPVMNMLANGSFVLDFDGEPWLVTAVADALILNLSAAVQVSGRLYYTQSA